MTVATIAQVPPATQSTSVDLPFAWKRFCDVEGIDRVITPSDCKCRACGEAYCVHVRELGLLTCALFAVNREGAVVHAEYVPEVTNKPDYAEAIKTVKAPLHEDSLFSASKRATSMAST